MEVVVYTYAEAECRPAKPFSARMVWGWEIDRVYQDWGTRQEWEQLLIDAESKPIAWVLVQHLGELGESVVAAGNRLRQLQRKGLRLMALDASPSIASMAELLTFWETVDTLQIQQRSRRIQQGHAKNRLQTLPPPGKAPYGYRRGRDRYLVDRATAPIVKDFFEHFLLYGSLRGSVRHLQATYNKEISVSTGKRWLTSAVYRGDLSYKTGDVIPNTHEPLLSRQEAAQIDRLLRRNRPLPPRTASAERSLSGLVVCATCQSPMTAASVSAPRRSSTYEYLRPLRCPQQPRCRSLRYADILDQTIQTICQTLPTVFGNIPVEGATQPNQRKADLEAAIAAKQSILKELPALVDQGILDDETAALRTYKVKTEIAALQQAIAQLPPVDLQAIAQVISLPQFWYDLSETERRFYFREFIQQIQLHRLEEGWKIQLQFRF
ncbi:MAG: recombinase family protein [Cyanobacteria bacterium J06638_22]